MRQDEYRKKFENSGVVRDGAAFSDGWVSAGISGNCSDDVERQWYFFSGIYGTLPKPGTILLVFLGDFFGYGRRFFVSRFLFAKRYRKFGSEV